MNQTYTVKRGDTLYGISNQFGVSVSELASLNNIKGSSLSIGQIIKIPNKAGTNPNTLFMYTVKSGDTLYKIAMKYNTTVNEILKLNYLTDTNLKIGQVLRIPEMYTPEDQMIMPEYINYTVKKGDTIYSIARTYNIDINTLVKDNALTSTSLSIGENLKIRTNKDTVEECFGVDYSPPDTVSTTTYTIKKGDNLYNIAKKYNTSVTAILNLNNLKNANLSIGQVIKIPNTTGSTTTTYTVKSGDSLYSIARKFNTTVDNLKRKNNLTSNSLRIGQNLNI